MRIIQASHIYTQRPGGPAAGAPADARVPPPRGGLPPATDQPAVILYSTRHLHTAGHDGPRGLFAKDIAAAGPAIEARTVTASHRQTIAMQTFNRVAEFDGTLSIIDVYA